MSDILLIKSDEVRFGPFGDVTEGASLGRIIGEETSRTIGAGMATFDGASIEWTVLYDEIILVMSGKFRVRSGPGFKNTIEAYQGDTIWLPANTSVIYEGERAKVFYVIYPVDWRKRSIKTS